MRLEEKKVIPLALVSTAILVILVLTLLLTMRVPEVRRIPVQEYYYLGSLVNSYTLLLFPIIIVLAILFIAGLSTFGLYHGATRPGGKHG